MNNSRPIKLEKNSNNSKNSRHYLKKDIYECKEEYDNSASNNEFFENQILDVNQTAKFLGVSTKKVYQLSVDGILPHKKLGRKYKFLRSELIRFLKGE
jgi:excisionase family DNA binding protein